VGQRSGMTPERGYPRAVRLKGLQEKGPVRLAVEGTLVGAFLAAIVTHGDFSAAWQVGIGMGIICGLIGLVYRGVRRLRS
jgi:hypothetical protein